MISRFLASRRAAAIHIRQMGGRARFVADVEFSIYVRHSQLSRELRDLSMPRLYIFHILCRYYDTEFIERVSRQT